MLTFKFSPSLIICLSLSNAIDFSLNSLACIRLNADDFFNSVTNVADPTVIHTNHHRIQRIAIDSWSYPLEARLSWFKNPMYLKEVPLRFINVGKSFVMG